MLSAASRSRRSVSSTCASHASRSSLLAQIFLRFFPIVTVHEASDDSNFFENIVQSKRAPPGARNALSAAADPRQQNPACCRDSQDALRDRATSIGAVKTAATRRRAGGELTRLRRIAVRAQL